MKNLTDLSDKRILFIGGESALEKVVIKQLLSMDASVEVYNPNVEGENKPHGQFDGVVYGIVSSDFRPLKMVSHDNLLQIVNQNYFLFIDVLRDLLKSKGIKNNSSIVVYSSISSIHAMKAKMAFSSAKAALDAAVRCLAVELAPVMNINFFSFVELVRCLSLKGNFSPNGMNIVGISDEIANMTGFLLSDAVRTMTGTSIVIDSGYTLL